MVRDLVEISVKMESDQNRVSFQAKAEELAEEKIQIYLYTKKLKIMKQDKNLEKCLEKENWMIAKLKYQFQ